MAIDIVCPVCIIDGLAIASCRFLGLPDSVTAFFLGIITLSLAIVTLHWIKSKYSLEKAPKGLLLFITAMYSISTLLAMKIVGMI